MNPVGFQPRKIPQQKGPGGHLPPVPTYGDLSSSNLPHRSFSVSMLFSCPVAEAQSLPRLGERLCQSWRDATRVGGNSPTEAFFQWKMSSQTTLSPS